MLAFSRSRVLASRDHLHAVHRPRRIIVGGDSPARAACRWRRRCAAEYRAGADLGWLFVAEDPARYRLTSATARTAEPNPHGARGAVTQLPQHTAELRVGPLRHTKSSIRAGLRRTASAAGS